MLGPGRGLTRLGLTYTACKHRHRDLNADKMFTALLTPGKEGLARRQLMPRTGDGRHLLLLVVDGRQPGFSLGVNLAELAQLLAGLGASEAINLDGGGTSTLVVTGPDGRPQVLNRPIHRGQSGRERVSASHLGLWALPLTSDTPPVQR